MRIKFDGNKRDNVLVVVQNGEATATMQLGQPVMYNLSSTASAQLDGLSVVNPSTLGTIGYQLSAGVLATANLAVNQYGESIVYGYSQSTLVLLQSRATSTDSWSSAAAMASALLLVPDFNSNVWKTLANVAAQSSPQVILLDAVASAATKASNVVAADTRIVSTVLARAFVRML